MERRAITGEDRIFPQSLFCEKTYTKDDLDEFLDLQEGAGLLAVNGVIHNSDPQLHSSQLTTSVESWGCPQERSMNNPVEAQELPFITEQLTTSTPPCRDDGPEVFVNKEAAVKPPNQLEKAYSESETLDDIMEIVDGLMKEGGDVNSKVWSNPTVTLGKDSKVFQAESPAMKNLDARTSPPSHNTDTVSPKDGSRKRTSGEDKAFTENNLYGKIRKNETANSVGVHSISPPATTYQTSFAEKIQQPSKTGHANVVMDHERSPAPSASSQMTRTSVFQLNADPPTYYPGSCESQYQFGQENYNGLPASTHVVYTGGNVHRQDPYAVSMQEFATNSKIQQNRHYCLPALSHAAVTQSRHPPGQCSEVTADQLLVQQRSPDTFAGTMVSDMPHAWQVPQGAATHGLGQFAPATTLTDGFSSGATHSESASRLHVAAPVDPSRLGVVSNMHTRGVGNKTSIRPAPSSAPSEERVKSFSRNLTFMMQFHKMIGDLARSGFFLSTMHDNMIECADKSCSILHLVPNVLHKDSSQVKWHKPHCRFYWERRPCKYCVGSKNLRIECLKCGQTSQASC